MKAWPATLAGVVAAGMLVGGCHTWRQGGRTAPKTTPLSAQTPASETPPAAAVPAGGFPPAGILPGLHECLTTPEGLRRKVVVTQAGVRAVDVPNGTRLVGEEMALFRELFVLDVRPSIENPEWYLVSLSPRKAHKVGWLHKASVAEWNTRLGLRPIAPVLFFAEQSEAEELAITGRTSASPIGRAAGDEARAYLPWPIVASATVTNAKGQIVEVALLNLIGERRLGDDVGDAAAQVVRYSDVRKRQVMEATGVICLAFCVDNTNSTDPFVPQIVKFIVDTSSMVQEQRPELRLALTLYRDEVEGLKWGDSVTNTYWGGVPQPIEAFLEGVRPITAPSASSVDWPECAYQGLRETLVATQWEKLHHKVLVWISDNSAHPKGSPQNPDVGPEEIIELARARGVTIHAVAIEGGGGEIEQARHSAQCREIAEATGGMLCGLDDAELLAAEISKVVQREHAIVRKNREELDLIAKGQMTLQQYTAARDPGDLRRRYQFVRLLASAGIDLEGFAPDEPTFVQGWVPTQLPGGQPLFERMVYVSRLELDVLLSELNNLVALLSLDSVKGLVEIYQTGLGARVGDQSFFSNKREGDIPFDVFMAARGIPLRTGITLKTREELLAMSPDEKFLLKARLVDEVIPNLTNARSSSAFTLTGDFDFGWIPEGLLP